MSSLYGTICLSEIPRSQMKKIKCKDGKERIFLNVFIGERKQPATFGERTYTHFVSCSPRPEERIDGEKYFIGDLMTSNPAPSQPSPEDVASAPAVTEADDLPF